MEKRVPSRDKVFCRPKQTETDEEVEEPKRENKLDVHPSVESDSLPECSTAYLNRKKRPFRKKKSAQMDVDQISKPCSSNADPMEVDLDGFESQISSSEDETTQGDCEADDEGESDWYGYSHADGDSFNPSDRQTRRLRQSKVELSQLEKRLERFALSNDDSEMGLEFKIKDRPNSAHLHRLLLHYRLEVVKRQQGNVVLRKKPNGTSAPE